MFGRAAAPSSDKRTAVTFLVCTAEFMQRAQLACMPLNSIAAKTWGPFRSDHTLTDNLRFLTHWRRGILHAECLWKCCKSWSEEWRHCHLHQLILWRWAVALGQLELHSICPLSCPFASHHYLCKAFSLLTFIILVKDKEQIRNCPLIHCKQTYTSNADRACSQLLWGFRAFGGSKERVELCRWKVQMTQSMWGGFQRRRLPPALGGSWQLLRRRMQLTSVLVCSLCPLLFP